MTWRKLSPRCIRLGDFVETHRTFTTSDVAIYSKLVGDTNPIHLDPAAANKAGFDNCIVHGMLVASLFSDILGRDLPGPQSVYVSQTLQFKAPVLVDHAVTTRIEVVEFAAKKGLIALRTTVTNNTTGKLAIDGTCIGMNKVVTFEGESQWTFQRPSR